ncbi:hypothetical protein FRC01_003071 [Tulasnella sp. 417]|nr:hypothetical protein FRC01_003071 [Tulasnella sp. 417]
MAPDENHPLLLQIPAPSPKPSPLQRLKKFLGFSKRYNFIQWIFMFCLMFIVMMNGLNFIGNLSIRFAPGEWYWFRQPFYKFGIILHLATILPCGFLAVFQFVPAIRYKYISLHRLNGFMVYTLLGLGIVGALMLTRRAMGGAPSTQVALIIIASLSATSACLAWYSIRFRRRIDLHRRWNIRTAFYAGSAITERIFLNGLAPILATQSEKQYFVWTCDELQFLIGNGTEVLLRYPSCIQFSVAPVPASLSSAEGVGTALRIAFSASTLLGIAFHAVLAEVYLQATWSESERLEQVSKAKELARVRAATIPSNPPDHAM